MKPVRFSAGKKSQSIFSGDSAFTILELLVVIAIIVILASLTFPVLGGAKARGKGIVCLNNQRQLTLAATVYTLDQEDRLPNNYGDVQMKQTVADGKFLNWNNNLMNWELDPQNTNTAIAAAWGLGTYCSGAASVFKCPTDFVLHEFQKAAGWKSRVRSYSMNAMVGDPGNFLEGGANVNNPHYRQYLKLTEIPDPSHIFMFIEEHPQSIYDGYFLNNPYVLQWMELPASYHSGGAFLSFADGHVEKRTWVNASTRQPNIPESFILPLDIPTGETADFFWLKDRTSRKAAYTYSASP